MIVATPDIPQAVRPANHLTNKNTVAAVEMVRSREPQPLVALTSLFNGPNFTTAIPVLDKTNKSRVEIPERREWTPVLEGKFTRLARMKALGRLGLEQQVEFEKLSAFRRGAHPRSGEEIIAEFNQRVLTRELVQALTKYVEFHEHAQDRQRKTS
jgi:hypothetical protein